MTENDEKKGRTGSFGRKVLRGRLRYGIFNTVVKWRNEGLILSVLFAFFREKGKSCRCK